MLEGKSIRASSYFNVTGDFFKPLYAGQIAYNVNYVDYRFNHSAGTIEFLDANNNVTNTFDTQSGQVD